MKKARILSAILCFVMVLAIFAAIPLGTAAASTVIISMTNPVICCNVGEGIDLSLYGVQVNASSTIAAGSAVWKKDGQTVSKFKPTAAGVTKLVASKDSLTKNIYVVAKEKSATEYVLYQNDFNSGAWADLEKEGWKNVTGGTITVSGGALHIDAKNIEVQQTLMPDWLKEFGDIEITAMVTETEVLNASRWCSVMYRCEEKYNGSSKHYYPFYHMCVRANTTSSTIEFAERNSSDGWNVINQITETVNMTQDGKYHKLAVRAFGKTVEYLLDDKSEFFATAASAHTAGYLGFCTNYGVMNIDSVKVTVLSEAPARPKVDAKLINTALNRAETNVANYVSNHAFATEAEVDSVLNGKVLPAGLVIDLKGKTLDASKVASLLKKCADKNVIPELQLDSKAQVDVLVKALTDSKVPEAVVVSEDAAVVKYAREKSKTVIRAALDCTSLDKKSLTNDDLYDIYAKAAGAYAQAVLLPYDLATKANVAELQIYELGVWACGKGIDTDMEASWLIASGANAVVTDNPAFIVATQNKLFTAKNSLTRTPVWTAHRGYFASVPENSMAAFKAGYENGADQLECDIHLTSDGVAVICHDGTIDRTFNGTGSIASMTYNQLLQYRLLHNGKATEEVIPTFEQLLQYCQGKDVRILCELKSSQTKLAQTAVDLIKKYKMEKQVMFISFTESQLTKAKLYMPVSTGDLNGSAGTNDPSELEATLNSYFEAQKRALGYHATLALNYGGITYEFIRDANDRGMTIWSWTYSDSLRAQVCTNFLSGMNGMTTNGITMLKNTVKTIKTPADLYTKKGGSASYQLDATTYGRVTSNVTAKAKVIEIKNDGVADFSEVGKVKGLKDGTAVFMLSYEAKLPNNTAFTLYTQPITVTVGDSAPLTLLPSSPYAIEGGYLANLKEKTTVAELKTNFVNGSSLVIKNANGKELVDTAVVGTGCTVSESGNTMTIVIKGEVNGDGKVDAFDYMLLKGIYLKTKQATELMLKAGDVSGNKIIDPVDYLRVKSHVLKTINLFE